MSGHMKRKGTGVLHVFPNRPFRGLLSTFRAVGYVVTVAVGVSPVL